MKGFSSQKPFVSLDTFMSSIGHRLRSLELRGVIKVNFDAVFGHCGSLEYLDLQGTVLDFRSDGALLSFLRSPYGCQLRSLNLNSTALYDTTSEELAELMKDVQCIPRLRELRLFLYSQKVAGLEILSDALSKNKTIGLVELCALFSADVRGNSVTRTTTQKSI